MNALFTAIFTRYNDATAESIALRAALTNKLHFYEPPQGTEFPYGIFFLVSNVPNDAFVEEFENATIQFSLFSSRETADDPADEICDLYEKLDDVYNKCALEGLVGYTLVSMLRETSSLLPLEDGVYQYNVDYRVLLEKD